jgi:hypothetical protein
MKTNTNASSAKQSNTASTPTERNAVDDTKLFDPIYLEFIGYLVKISKWAKEKIGKEEHEFIWDDLEKLCNNIVESLNNIGNLVSYELKERTYYSHIYGNKN